MPRKGDVHVVPGERAWRVEVEGQARASGTHQTQQAAWQQAKQIAQRNQSEALLHGRNGQIRERNTYGRIRDEARADATPPRSPRAALA